MKMRMKVGNGIVHGIALACLLVTACGGGIGTGSGGSFTSEPDPEPLDDDDASWLDVSGATLSGRLGSMDAASGTPDDARARYEGGLWFYLEHQQGGDFGRAILEVPYDWTTTGGVLVSTLALGDDPTRASLWGIAAEETDALVTATGPRPYSCSGQQGGLCGSRQDADDFIVRISPCGSCAGDARNIDFVFWTGDDQIDGQLTVKP